MAAKIDKRGHVAVVSNSSEGPRVSFIGGTLGIRTHREALEVALSVYATRDGETNYSFPRTFHVQRHGQWVAL